MKLRSEPALPTIKKKRAIGKRAIGIVPEGILGDVPAPMTEEDHMVIEGGVPHQVATVTDRRVVGVTVGSLGMDHHLVMGHGGGRAIGNDRDLMVRVGTVGVDLQAGTKMIMITLRVDLQDVDLQGVDHQGVDHQGVGLQGVGLQEMVMMIAVPRRVVRVVALLEIIHGSAERLGSSA